MESVQPKSTLTSKIIWLLVAIVGAVSFGILALSKRVSVRFNFLDNNGFLTSMLPINRDS
jgi:hypothetical protein